LADVLTMRRPEVDPDTFEAFWRAYPRKVGKPLAEAKWNAITNGGLRTRTLDKDSNTYVEITLSATPAEILDAAKRYDQRNRKKGIGEFGYVDDGKYICHPATWLNQGRFYDE
jgi:hypothetical protein